ncbi:MAG: hypothetical protein ISR59_10945 [Anaerolineales bacterium]|uniref:Nbr1 FW domain-containing protein n=1 Tax=Candidatus Desulfolinea nitratireducens TaxID=2841698 RepID=A0A8J6TJI9_9CHLR|nr:hypothetical protein [Candidatus Desulfolinea nitratireducens]MBL6961616.1 hypothetical protein [Anaerolineales bacterium]
MKNKSSIYTLIVLVLVLSGCMPTTPEAPIVSVETIVAATYAVIQAQTAAAEAVIPTATLIPPTPTKLFATFTPIATSTSFIVSSLTPVPTATMPPSLTPTNVTSGSGDILYSCEVVGSSPASGFEVKKNKEFTWTLHVKNIGTTIWSGGDTKLAHIKGAEYYILKRVLIEKTTNAGEIGEFRVALFAPEEPGRYSSTWTMRRGINDFCEIKYQIYVVK